MSITVRKRGSRYYIRGTVRDPSGKIHRLKERTAGVSTLVEAKVVARAVELREIERLENPKEFAQKNTTFNECFKNYVSKKELTDSQKRFLKVLVDVLADCPVDQIKQKWNDYCISKQQSPATINRYSAILNAILRRAQLDLDINTPIISMLRVQKKGTFKMDDVTRKRLLKCYSDSAYPIFVTLAVQGFRTQECLQIQWEDVNFNNDTILIRQSKNGEPRVAEMHPMLKAILLTLWEKRGKPHKGHVWLNRYGKPYTDTRKTANGSNPLKRAHELALKRYKEKYGESLKMRIHDWRHDWATRMVSAGCDLKTLCDAGGWKSISMVTRYASSSPERQREFLKRVGI